MGRKERWPSLVQHIGSDRYSLNLVVDLCFVHCILHGVFWFDSHYDDLDGMVYRVLICNE